MPTPKAPTLTLCVELQAPLAQAQARLKSALVLAARLKPRAACLPFSRDSALVEALKKAKPTPILVPAGAWASLPALLPALKSDWVALFPATAELNAKALAVDSALLPTTDFFLQRGQSRPDERLWRALRRFGPADLSAAALLRVSSLAPAASANQGAFAGASALRRCLDQGARVHWRGFSTAAPWAGLEADAPRLPNGFKPGRATAWAGVTLAIFLLAKLLLYFEENTIAVLLLSLSVLTLGQALGDRP